MAQHRDKGLVTLSADEILVARAVRPDLVDGEYESGSDGVVDINMQYPSPTGHATVTVNGLRVRIQPSLFALEIGTLDAGDLVEVWGSVGDWLLVRKDELHGWSATKYLERV